MSKSYTVGYMPKPSYSGTKYEELKDVLKESGIISEHTPDNAIPTVVEESLVDLKPENIQAGVTIGNVEGILNLNLSHIQFEDIDPVSLEYRFTFNVDKYNHKYNYMYITSDNTTMYATFSSSSNPGLWHINISTGEETLLLDHPDVYAYSIMAEDSNGWVYLTNNSSRNYSLIRVKNTTVEDLSTLATLNPNRFILDEDGTVYISSYSKNAIYACTESEIIKIYGSKIVRHVYSNYVCFGSTQPGLYCIRNKEVIQLYNRGYSWTSTLLHNNGLYVSGESNDTGILYIEEDTCTVISETEYGSLQILDNYIYSRNAYTKPFLINDKNELFIVGPSKPSGYTYVQIYSVSIPDIENNVYVCTSITGNPDYPNIYRYNLDTNTMYPIVLDINLTTSQLHTTKTHIYLHGSYINESGTRMYASVRVNKTDFSYIFLVNSSSSNSDKISSDPKHYITLPNGIEIIKLYNSIYTSSGLYAITPLGTPISLGNTSNNVSVYTVYEETQSGTPIILVYIDRYIKRIQYDSAQDMITWTNLISGSSSSPTIVIGQSPIKYKDLLIVPLSNYFTVLNVSTQEILWCSSLSVGVSFNFYKQVNDTTYILYSSISARTVCIMSLTDESTIKFYKATY